MDEIFSLDILYSNDTVPEELYILVRDGLYSQLDTRLHELSNSTEYLRTLTWHNQGQLSLLMVASLNGYDDIVHLLLTHDKSINQIELKGRIFISNEDYINGATALYCACYRKHFSIAKILIEYGKANVNQDTYDYPYYPLLIHATLMNRFDIIEFLIENKYSDINETKTYDENEYTALIWASFRGYTYLVEYFIKNNANINYSCGDKCLNYGTPLTLAILAGHIDSIKLLCNANVNINIDNEYVKFLLSNAIDNKYYSIINFLIEQSLCTLEDVELAACSLIDISSSIERMYEVLKLLKLILQQRKLLNIPKMIIESLDIYDYKQECQTIDELDYIKDNHKRIFIETLLIRERIFLSHFDKSIIEPLEEYSDKLAFNEEFNKSFNVNIRLYNYYQKINSGCIYHRFVWLFCKMLTANQKISINHFLQISYLIFKLPEDKDIEININNALFLVIIATKILQQKDITKDEQILIYCWIKDLCKYQLNYKYNKTLLHLCVDKKTNNNLNFRRRDTTSHITFPNILGLELLLSYGSRWLDINAIESIYGNTPLHIICQTTEDRKMIQLLIDFGCHTDCVNKDKKIPFDYLKDKETKDIFTLKINPIRLKCLCARTIVDKHLNINHFGLLTSVLNKFIILHDCSRSSFNCN